MRGKAIEVAFPHVTENNIQVGLQFELSSYLNHRKLQNMISITVSNIMTKASAIISGIGNISPLLWNFISNIAINTKNDTALTIRYAPARRNNFSLYLFNRSKVTAISAKIAVKISNIAMTVDPVVTIGLAKAGEAQTIRRIIA